MSQTARTLRRCRQPGVGAARCVSQPPGSRKRKRTLQRQRRAQAAKRAPMGPAAPAAGSRISSTRWRQTTTTVISSRRQQTSRRSQQQRRLQQPLMHQRHSASMHSSQYNVQRTCRVAVSLEMPAAAAQLWTQMHGRGHGGRLRRSMVQTRRDLRAPQTRRRPWSASSPTDGTLLRCATSAATHSLAVAIRHPLADGSCWRGVAAWFGLAVECVLGPRVAKVAQGREDARGGGGTAAAAHGALRGAAGGGQPAVARRPAGPVAVGAHGCANRAVAEPCLNIPQLAAG